MTAPTEGPQRKFKTYQHPTGDYTIEAHTVTEDTAGVITTPGQQSLKVGPGDVMLRTSHPDVYTVYPANIWRDMGFKEQGNGASDQPDRGEATDLPDDYNTDEEVLEEGVFDPNTRTAREVNEYLSRTDLSTAERERVIEVERTGKNRSSAFPR